MTDYKQIVIAFLGTAVLILGLAVWVGFKNGEPLPFSGENETLEGIDIPLSPEAASEVKKAGDAYSADGTIKQEALNSTNQPTKTDSPMPQENKRATFDTTEGKVVLELFMDKMPITAGNFAKLASDGYYNGTQFHRVIPGFMVQGGDPNSKGADKSKYGTGGPGYAIQDEFVAGLSNIRGSISMANSGPNSGGSQFFINVVDNVGLDFDKEPMSSAHPVFGRVVEGMDIVDKISKVETGPRDLPVTPVLVNSITVE